MNFISVLVKYWVLLIVALVAAWLTGANMSDGKTVALLVGAITIFYAVYTYLIYRGTQKKLKKEEAARAEAQAAARRPQSRKKNR